MTVKYADKDSINNLISLLGSKAQDFLIEEAMSNGDATVRSRLKKYNIDVPSKEGETPESLVKAANYYAISDILQGLNLNQPKDRSANEQGYYEKAETLICDYIKEILDKREKEEAKKKHPYRVSKGKSQIAKIFR